MLTTSKENSTSRGTFFRLCLQFKWKSKKNFSFVIHCHHRYVSIWYFWATKQSRKKNLKSNVTVATMQHVTKNEIYPQAIRCFSIFIIFGVKFKFSNRIIGWVFLEGSKRYKMQKKKITKCVTNCMEITVPFVAIYFLCVS